eukprot:TRINITY_DN10574_c0_g1_i1.p1 TRINITY_DN10574_c0_g1~~TRINITY_DN10574_c0_g1_i1.p1  ORF type:complete len:556 (+),score=125.33 TRINITY_DN10574_c0_g1_i1:78-1745(+)
MDTTSSYTSESYSSESYEEGPPPAPKEYPKGYNMWDQQFSSTERKMPEVECPPSLYLGSEFWVEENVPNVQVIKDHLAKEGRLSKEQMISIVDLASEQLCQEPNVLAVPAPVTVCGDIHGQFFDLLKLFEVGGDPSETSYLFLGDYVDRGNFSVECVILLYLYKILHPSTFFMLRGNHECRHLTSYFTFKEECEYKYDEEIYDLIMESFDALPLAAVMNKQFFCVHGGLSPSIKTVSQINDIDRFREPPSQGPMCDLLWSDPMDDYSTTTRKLENAYVENTVRGCSYCYSYTAVCKFLDDNQLLSVVRAHEAQDAGYRMYKKNNATGFPSVITLFSAPNYLETYNNKGAILRYENNVINIRQFNHTAHPYYLPGFMNVFQWSLPFVAEKVGEILLAVLDIVDDEDEEEWKEKQLAEAEEKKRKQEILLAKVKSVSKMVSMFSQIRNEREIAMAVGGISGSGGSLPSSVPRTTSASDLRALASSFEGAYSLDVENEARPPDVGIYVEKQQNTPLSPKLVRTRSNPTLFNAAMVVEDIEGEDKEGIPHVICDDDGDR